MTDPAMPQPRPAATRRWLLIASLTLNLLVVGVVAGTALRHAGGEGGPEAGRALGFGPWSRGLSHEDHQALRRAFEASGQDFRAAWREERADRAALILALQAEPFDPAALDAIAARMHARSIARMDLGQQLIRDHVVAMTPQARRAFAERMQAEPRRERDRAAERSKP